MKRHPINQSQLYSVTSPMQLATRLGISMVELEELANQSNNYKRFKIGKGKKRDVQEPKDRLGRVHRKVMRWLSCIETPNYLHSAVRGKSYITNARTHSADDNLVKVDIRSFYQNVRLHAVYLFFANSMKCRKDVAMLLAKLLTVDGHLATGSAVSPILSYFAHRGMFDDIAQFADDLGLSFTVYIDDMCLSGERASRATLFRVRRIIARHGLQSHKCRYFPAGVSRVVTGNALTRNGIRLPHRRHLKIKEAFDTLDAMPEGSAREKLLHALQSRLYEAAQLEPIWRERARSLRVKNSSTTLHGS